MSDIRIVRGSTVRWVRRWATSGCTLVPAILVPGAPVLLRAHAHGIPDGWPVRVEGTRDDIDWKRAFPAKVIDDDTIELSCVNGSRFTVDHVVIRYNKPVELTGYNARMPILDRIGGTTLLEPTSNGVEGEPRIILDDVAKTIVFVMPADAWADIDWSIAVFALFMQQGDYVAPPIDSGKIIVEVKS